MPLVSVVIPTINRPALLRRAIASVLEQTFSDFEIIVVVDGPDADTIESLETIEDPRLTVIVNPSSLTAAGARNAGVDLAKGDWIAFLDDDDEWLPDKLEKQLAYAAGRGRALITCLSRVVTPTTSFVRPQLVYDNNRPIDEYLFDRRLPSDHYGFIQTSTFLLARELFEQVRFRTESPHDDWDFLLRLSKQHAVKVETVPEILVNFYADEPRPSLSRSGKWRASLLWADRMRPFMTSRAYSSFCLSVVASRAARERAYGAIVPLLYRSFRSGPPRSWRLAAFLGLWLIPMRALESLRRILWRAREASA